MSRTLGITGCALSLTLLMPDDSFQITLHSPLPVFPPNPLSPTDVFVLGHNLRCSEASL